MRSFFRGRRKEPPRDKRCELCQSNYDFSQFMETYTELHVLGKFDEIAEHRDCPLCGAILQRLSHELDVRVVNPKVGSHEVSLDPKRYGALNSGGLEIYHGDHMRGLLSQWEGGKVPSQHVKISSVDVNQVSKWLSECEERHGTTCGSGTMPGDHDAMDLIFIDVLDEALVTMSSTCQYLALSYVWGRVNALQTTLANFSQLSRPGALRDHKLLPKVVKDAMRLVRALGKRYLWVDALCIVQDDFLHKPAMLAQMDRIYIQAFLTIVAVAGVDATKGLPGISADPRSPLWTITNPYDNIHIISHPPPLVELLRGSWYEARAWTFQERLLSKRTLYFSDQQMYFQCLTDIKQEDGLGSGATSFRPENPLENIPVPLKGRAPSEHAWVDSLEAYMYLVKLYTKKQLTYPSDILNAFLGIATVLTRRCGSTFTAGLPEAVFDVALLWRTCDKIVPKRRLIDDVYPQPSWSWSGWVGPTTFLLDQEGLEAVLTRGSDRKYFTLGLECSNGKIPFKPMVSKFKILGVDGSIRTIQRQTALFEYPGFPDSLPEELEEIEGLNLTRQNVLLFWTFVTKMDSFTMTKKLGTVQDQNGAVCGIMFPPVCLLPDSQEMGSREVILLGLMQWNKFPRFLEFSELPFSHVGHLSKKDVTPPWCIAVVLLIEWKEGYAERLGVGMIDLNAWEMTQPTKKLIKLA